ncbi:DUF3953 domain-containing protein [Paenibacillus polymyxa]|nr:hypothetical protein RE92_07425 [Paenibacillus polymyxa]QOH60705.1 DUF3953 domain-containing protein [Paenibacillus polymyxa]
MFKKMNIYWILTLIFAVVALISSFLSLTYPDTYGDLYKVSQFFLGFMFLFSGITEFKAQRKVIAIINFSVSLLTFLVSIFALVAPTG